MTFFGLKTMRDARIEIIYIMSLTSQDSVLMSFTLVIQLESKKSNGQILWLRQYWLIYKKDMIPS